MTHKILVTIVLLCYSLISFAQQKNDSVTLINRPVDVGFIYPINYVNYKNEKGADLIKHYLWSDITHYGHFNGLYIGGEAGITFKL